jgi:hypothetical protein
MLIPYEQFFIHTTNTDNLLQNKTQANKILSFSWALTPNTHHMTSLLDQYIPLNIWASSPSAMRAAGNAKQYVHI